MVPMTMRLLLRSLFSNVHATSVMLRKYGLQNANFSVCIDSYQPLTKFSRSVTRLANRRMRTLLPLNWCMRFCQWKMWTGSCLLELSLGDMHCLHYQIIQSWEKVFVCGLVKFVTAVACHFCLSLPETISQPRTKTFSQLCTLPP